MPWEKSFDTNDAIKKATNVFWAKGYETTSLADLLKAIGINKGSFYNAFGSKKSLFIQSLDCYDREHRRKILDHLESLEDPVLAINTLFDTFISESISPISSPCSLSFKNMACISLAPFFSILHRTFFKLILSFA